MGNAVARERRSEMLSPDDLRAAIISVPMTIVLIGVNLAVFIAVNVDRRLLDGLALPPDWARLLDQPWTVLTVFFTAEVLIHVAGAVLFLVIFGVRFERIAGAGHLLGVYLLAGLAGSLALLATAAVTGFDEPSVGASAAFLGLMGAVAACPREMWGTRLGHLEKAVAVVVVAQLAPALGVGDWVSSAAHLVGLGVGAAYGYRLRPTTTNRRANEEGKVSVR
jgi:membrane associated rhomboid family serine protease